MENASKALMIGAGILLGMLLIAIAIRLFNSAFGVVNTYDKRMEAIQVSEFNVKITRFIETDKENGQKPATIYDIVSLANFAYDYNSKVVEDPLNTTKEKDPIILEIAIRDPKKQFTLTNLQNHSDIYMDLIKECYYVNNQKPIADDIITFEIVETKNNSTGRINYVLFEPANVGGISARLRPFYLNNTWN